MAFFSSCPARRVFLALALAVAAVGGPAAATGAIVDVRAAKSLVVSAQLSAQGKGTVTLTGSVVAFGQVDGAPGTLYVVDNVGNARVTIGTTAWQLKKREKFTQAVPAGVRLYIEGTSVTLRLTAPQSLTLSAAARGTGRFAGSGSYSLNGSANVSWPRQSVSLRPASVPTPKPRVATTPPPPPSTGLQTQPAPTTTTTPASPPPAEKLVPTTTTPTTTTTTKTTTTTPTTATKPTG